MLQFAAKRVQLKNFLVLVVTLCLFFLTLTEIWSGAISPIWDADQAFAPWFSLVADFAKAGKLLLWSPWTDGGAPLFIETQIGSLSPLTVALAWLSPVGEAGYRFYWLAIWALGLIGMFCLMRSLAVSVWIAAVISLAFAFSGPFLGNAQHISWIYSFALLPWMTVLMIKAIKKNSAVWAWTAGAVWGVSAVGGYPGHWVASICFVGLFLVLGYWSKIANPLARHTLTLPRLIYFLGLFVISGVIVSIPTYFSLLQEGAGYTDRTGFLSKYRVISENALHPGTIITMFSPYLSLLQRQNKIWTYNDISSLNSYIGIVPLWVALVSILTRRVQGRYLALIALFFFVVAASLTFPVRGWLYDLLPPFRYFRHSSLFRFYFCFALCIYAGLALQQILSESIRIPKTVAVLAFLLIAAVPVGLKFSSIVVDQQFAYAWIFPVLSAAVLTIVHLLNIKKFKEIFLFIVLLLSIVDLWNVKLYGLEITFDRNPRIRQLWDQFNSQHIAKLNFTGRWQREVGNGADNKNLLLKNFELFSYSTLKNTYYSRQQEVNSFAALTTGELSFWYARQAVFLPLSEPAFEEYKRLSNSSSDPLLFVREPESISASSTDPLLQVSPAQLVDAKLQKLSVASEELKPTYRKAVLDVPEDGWLLVPERWSRGWKVRVNGVETTNYLANFSLRAFQVSKGTLSVIQSYEPKYLAALVFFSWSNLLVSIIYLLKKSLKV